MSKIIFLLFSRLMPPDCSFSMFLCQLPCTIFKKMLLVLIIAIYIHTYIYNNEKNVSCMPKFLCATSNKNMNGIIFLLGFLSNSNQCI